MQLLKIWYWQQFLQGNNVAVSKCQVLRRDTESHEHAKPLIEVLKEDED